MRWVIGALLVVFLWLQYRLWVGEGSLAEVHNLKQEIGRQKAELERVKKRNELLEAEVRDLKSGLEALEERSVQEHGFRGDPECIQEILSYPVARILVSSVGDPHLVRWYAHGEAVLFHQRLKGEGRGLLVALAGEMGLRAREGEGDRLDLHFTDYLVPASAIRAPEWKLINREVERGSVRLSAPELARLCLESLRMRIEDELPLPVPDELTLGFALEKGQVESALGKRKESIEADALGQVSITKMPPCVKQLMASTQGGVNLPHMGRFALAAFLHHIGMSAEDILAVYSASPDFDPSKARYQVEHITGEGSGTEYTPPECETMKTHGLCPGPDELCRRDWMSHPLTYYRVKDKDEKKRKGVKVGEGGKVESGESGESGESRESRESGKSGKSGD